MRICPADYESVVIGSLTCLESNCINTCLPFDCLLVDIMDALGVRMQSLVLNASDLHVD